MAFKLIAITLATNGDFDGARKTFQSITDDGRKIIAFEEIAKIIATNDDIDRAKERFLLAKEFVQSITDHGFRDMAFLTIAENPPFIAAGLDVSTYTGKNELVLNIQKIENGDVIDSDVDVDLDLLTHRFMAIIKQKAILKMKNGGHNVPTLQDICWKRVTEYLKNWDMFIEFINKGWGEHPNVQEVTKMPLFQYLRKHTQCTAAVAGGTEESKRDWDVFLAPSCNPF